MVELGCMFMEMGIRCSGVGVVLQDLFWEYGGVQ